MKIVNIFHGHFRESDFTVVGKICDKLIKVRTSTKLMNMINLVKLFFSRVNLQNDANAVIVIFLHSNKPLEKIVRLMFSVLFPHLIRLDDSFERSERSLKCLTYLLRFLRDIFRNSRIAIVYFCLS